MKTGSAIPRPVQVQAEQFKKSGKLKSADGNDYTYKAGDYKVWDNGGPDKSWVVDKEIFESTYHKNGGGKYEKKPTQTRFSIADRDGSLNTMEGPMAYKKGDYIITGPKGEQYPMSAERFGQRYHKVTFNKASAVDTASLLSTIDLRKVMPGIPEYAAECSLLEYQAIRLMTPEMANASTAVGKFAIYLMYFSLIGYLKDRKKALPKGLLSDLKTAYSRLSINELRKLGVPKTALVASESVTWLRDQLPSLREANRDIREMVKVPEAERKLLTLALRAARADVSESALKSLERTAWMLSPDLGGKIVSYALGVESSDGTNDSKKETGGKLEAANKALRAAVKALGGTGMVLDVDKARAASANAKLIDKYKAYLAARLALKKIFDIEFRKLIVGNGNKPMPVEDVEKKMKAKGFELLFMPTKSMGFHGKLGISGGKMGIFTNADILIHGNIAPGSKVEMNKKYDVTTDDAYVMRVMAPGGVQFNRFYTVTYKKTATATKFKKADDLSKNLSSILNAWKRDLKSTDMRTRMLATAAVTLYLTGARVGSNKTGMTSKKGVAGYGILNLRVKHIKFTAAKVIFNYPGKKGMPQKHALMLNKDAHKLIGKYLKGFAEGKSSEDLLFSIPAKTAGKMIEINFSMFSKYLRSIGFSQGAHKLRHVRGTELVRKLIAANPWKPTRAATTLAKRQKEAETFMKDKILTKVGALLGHMATDRASGGTKTVWRTSITSYVNPDVVRDWFAANKLDVPNWVPSKLED